MIESITMAKFCGALTGSSVAVLFKPGDDSWGKWAKRILLGTIIGFVSAPIILDSFTWDPGRWDHWLAAATLGGLCGYLSLQTLFSEKLAHLIEKIARSRT